MNRLTAPPCPIVSGRPGAKNRPRLILLTAFLFYTISLCGATVWAAGSATPNSSAGGGDALRVLPRRAGNSTTQTMMHQYLLHRAHEAFARNARDYEQLKTSEQFTAWQERIRRFMTTQLGGFPERTPLNARVTGILARPGYRIEKITFESQPGFTVPALLYLPAGGKPPYPAVLIPSGHSDNGKAYDEYQRAAILLVRNGMAVLAYEPTDQGERCQLLDAAGKPRVKGVMGHCLAGAGAMLLGRNMATYEIWDGIRAIDYLLTRPEIDPARIGCTGNSGGGTQTAYLMALEPRLAAAAPGCYITSLPRLLETIGPQDAEQNIAGQIAGGLDHSGYLMLFAPRPAAVLVATQDFFDIAGAWDSFRLAKRIYGRLGASDKLDIFESDQKHGFSPAFRAEAARFFRHVFLHSDDVVGEPAEQPILEDQETWCCPGGLVVHREGERTVYDLNAAEETRLVAERRQFWEKDPAAALRKVRRLTGIRPLASLPATECQRVGMIQREGYRIEKLLLTPEPGIQLPALAFVPAKITGDPVLYLDGAGKERGAAVGGAEEELVRMGSVVLAVDLRGCGETAPGGSSARSELGKALGAEWSDAFLAYQLGTSYLAMRAEDTLVCARFLAGWPAGDKARKVSLVGIGGAAPAALHAAALDPALFGEVCLKDGEPASWAEVVRKPLNTGAFVNLVHGALRVYDLPDLKRALPAGLLLPQ